MCFGHRADRPGNNCRVAQKCIRSSSTRITSVSPRNREAGSSFKWVSLVYRRCQLISERSQLACIADPAYMGHCNLTVNVDASRTVLWPLQSVKEATCKQIRNKLCSGSSGQQETSARRSTTRPRTHDRNGPMYSDHRLNFTVPWWLPSHLVLCAPGMTCRQPLARQASPAGAGAPRWRWRSWRYAVESLERLHMAYRSKRIEPSMSVPKSVTTTKICFGPVPGAAVTTNV